MLRVLPHLLALLLAACQSTEPPETQTASVADPLAICAPYDESLLDALDAEAQVKWLTERMKTCKAACQEAENCDADDDAAMAVDYYNRANAQGELGRHAEAVVDYSRSLALQPGFLPAHAQRAMELVELDRFADALADADAAIALAPQDPRPHGLRCLILVELERSKEALASCETASALAPSVAALQVLHGLALARDGQAKAELARMEEAIAADPATVSMLQEQMQEAGFYAEPPSGSYDQATEAALKKWLAAGAPGELSS